MRIDITYELGRVEQSRQVYSYLIGSDWISGERPSKARSNSRYIPRSVRLVLGVGRAGRMANAAVLKTADRKVLQVRILCPPLLQPRRR